MSLKGKIKKRMNILHDWTHHFGLGVLSDYYFTATVKPV